MRGVTAAVHHAPETFECRSEMCGRFDHLVKQLFEAPVRDQPLGFVVRADILGEHREKATHQKFGDLDRRVFLLQPPGDLGQPGGDVARHLGRFARGVERLGIGPDRRQPRLDLAVEQIVHRQAVAVAIGEMIVILSQAGEVRIDFDDVADIGDQQEWRIAMINGESAGIILGLASGGDHHLVPVFGAAFSVTKLLHAFQPGERQLFRVH